MIFNLLDQPALLIIVPLAIVIVIAVHEFSHALVAFWLGDQTAAQQGRLTLNPLAHLDPAGTIMLLVVGFGWGKPVPFNPYNLKYQKWGPTMIALAGPVSNFIWAIIFALVFKFSLGWLEPESLALQFLLYLIFFNVILGIFNLIPIPPLDGSKALFAILPLKYEKLAFWLQRNGSFLLIGLLLFLYLSDSNFFQNLVGQLVDLIFRLIGVV